jgi:hypothetical protein
MRALLLILFALLSFPAFSSTSPYTDNLDGTVSDSRTGLMWKQCAEGQTWAEGQTLTDTCGSSDLASKSTWGDAKLPTDNFAGKSDWRLPNVRELQSIVDWSINTPAIDEKSFPNAPSDYFWSSSPYGLDDPEINAWSVLFERGIADGNPVGAKYAVRLVRTESSPALPNPLNPLNPLNLERPTTDYADQHNGTVAHQLSGLIWKQCAEGQAWSGSTCIGTASTYIWTKAKGLTSTFAGKSDWRLPTEDELLSLVDYTVIPPAINATLFPLTPTLHSFWSTSSTPTYAWSVDFSTGRTSFDPSFDPQSTTNYVRLVRTGPSTPSTFVLTVSVTDDGGIHSVGGSISSAPAGIACGSTCNKTFNSGTLVILTVTLNPGYRFTGWNGAGCTGTATCTISMTGAKNVTAIFVLITVPIDCTYIFSPLSLTISASESGGSNITVTPSASSCTWSVSTSATWIHFPSSTHTGSGILIITVDANSGTTSRNASITIAGKIYTVTQSGVIIVIVGSTLTVSTTGSGTVSSTPVGIACGSTCSATFNSGTSVTLTATPASGYRFTGWGGACVGTAITTVTTTCTLTMTAAKSVTASFVSLTGTLAPYTDNGDGTVTDPRTGLIWMRCAMGQTWTGSTCSGTASTYTWAAAVALTGATSFAGKSDWRLPNIRELQTIVDRSTYNPAINTAAFQNTPNGWFWTASFSTPNAWYVYSNDGSSYVLGQSYDFVHVRLVRSGQLLGLLNPARPTTDYVDQGNGTAAHTPSGLVWKRCAEGQVWSGSTCIGSASTYTWDAARALSSTFAGNSDWRLPTAEELLSLADYTTYSPAINATLFPLTPWAYFWSASSYALNPTDAWYVDFNYGGTYAYSLKNHVRLVRTGQSVGNSAKLDFNGHSYQRFSSAMGWTAAKSFCEAKGAHLATITSQAENIFIAANFGSNVLWLGGSDAALEGRWTWITGEAWSYSNWNDGEPNNQGIENYLQFNRFVQGGFNDVNDDGNVDSQPLCEWESVNSPGTFTLNVSSSGGTISSAPAGIACGNTCSATFNDGTLVILTATPAFGKIFTGWGGACAWAGTATTCMLSMTAAKSVTAIFDVTVCTYSFYPVSLTLGDGGSGSGGSNITVTPSASSCTWSVSTSATWIHYIDRLKTGSGTLNITVDANSRTASRSASITIAGQTYTVNQSGAVIGYPLRLNVSTTGNGTVSSAPAGIACGSTCNAAFNSGTSVTLTATPAIGNSFIGWSGACSGTGQCVLTLNAAARVSAQFIQTPSVPVIEFYHSALKHYFITIDPNEADSIDAGAAGAGWTRTGKTFMVYTTQATGSQPVCRFYGSFDIGPNSHFYTVSTAECAALRAQQAITPETVKKWHYENTAFYIFTPVNGACTDNNTPVYRYYNNGFARGEDSNHRLSADPAQNASMEAAGWTNEGVVMCAPYITMIL